MKKAVTINLFALRTGLIFKTLLFCSLTLIPSVEAYSFGRKDSSPQANAQSVQGKEFVPDFPKYPDEFNEKMRQAYNLVQEGKYLEAVQAFTDDPEAFTLKKQKYIKKREGESEIALTENAIKTVKDEVLKYKKMQKTLLSLNSSFESSLKSSLYEQSIQNLEQIKQNLTSLSEIRNNVYNEGIKVKEEYERLVKEKEINDECWLSFTEKFILGTKTGGTGILGALDAHYLSLDQSLLDIICSKQEEIQKSIEKGLTKESLFSQGGIHEREQELSLEFTSLSSVMKSVIELKTMIEGKGSDRQKKKNKALENSAEYLSTAGQKISALLEEIKTLADLDEQTKLALQEENEAVEALRQNADSESPLYISFANSYARENKKIESLQKEKWIKELKNLDKAVPHWQNTASFYTECLSDIEEHCSEEGTAILERAGKRIDGACNEMQKEHSSLYEEIKKSAPGLEINLEEDENESTPKQHPTDFISRSGQVKEALDKDINFVKNASAVLKDADSSYKSTTSSLQKKIESSVKELENLSKTISSNSDKIREQQLEARTAINEVNMYYNRSLSAYENENLSTAQTNLEKAQKTYDSILTVLKKDADIQDQTFDNLTTLKQQIVEKQRPLLISNMRDYKREIRINYYAGNYEEASENIIRADNVLEEWERFMDTPMEKDEELEKLRELVNTARTMQSGRVLNPDDALYPEMSQILSLSNKYYSQGTKLIDTGKRREGIAALKKAKEKLDELRLVYPRNQEANILSLRIDRIIEPKEFNKMFSQKYAELEKIDYSKRDAEALTAYADLQDLIGINPSYPGLSSLLFNAEIQMGLRERTADNSSKEAAEAIAQEAQEALTAAGRDAALLSEIKAKANEALSLDPSNGTAIAVLDEIALRTGQQAAVSLSAADEAKYQQAIRFLQSGNVVGANANLQALLQTPANLRSAKVIKLKSRIEGMLK